LVFLVFAVVVVSGRFAHDTRNRGPADEVAPGTQPARDIDRSKAR
jgi:hypothetical protein